MIDISGQVQTSTDIPVEQEEENFFSDEFEDSHTEPPQDFLEDNESITEEYIEEETSIDDKTPVNPNWVDDEDATFFEEQEVQEPVEMSSPEEEEPLEEEFDETTQDVPEMVAASDEEEELETFPMPETPDPTPVDITNFANSEKSNLEEGELLYDVTVARIDSKDLREAFKYVLLDEKLKLNHHEYLKKIKDGKVTIPDLNPIKAKRIVEQLQYTDLDIKWRQKRVIMEVVEPEMLDEEDTEVPEDVGL